VFVPCTIGSVVLCSFSYGFYTALEKYHAASTVDAAIDAVVDTTRLGCAFITQVVHLCYVVHIALAMDSVPIQNVTFVMMPVDPIQFWVQVLYNFEYIFYEV
jgi:hypothetical protein